VPSPDICFGLSHKWLALTDALLSGFQQTCHIENKLPCKLMRKRIYCLQVLESLATYLRYMGIRTSFRIRMEGGDSFIKKLIKRLMEQKIQKI
jgi:hypothetical protein